MKRLTPDEYPQEIEDKLQDYNKKDYLIPSINLLRTKSQIEGIRKSAAINTALLNYITPFIKEGTTTEEIDKLVYDFTTKQGAIPATLNYEGFPKSVCISINDVVCHGIPSPYETFLDGDIVNIDVSTIYNGYFSDASRMFLIGDVSEEDKKLVRVAKECLELGIKEAQPWTQLGNVGYAIQQHAEKNGYSVVEDLCGHGVGIEFHEEPEV